MAFTEDPRDEYLRKFNRAQRDLPETALTGVSEAEAAELYKRGQDAQDRRTEKTRRTIADLNAEQS